MFKLNEFGGSIIGADIPCICDAVRMATNYVRSNDETTVFIKSEEYNIDIIVSCHSGMMSISGCPAIIDDVISLLVNNNQQLNGEQNVNSKI